MAYLHKEPIDSSATMLKNLFVRDREKGQYLICELLDLMMEPKHQAFIERREDLAGWVKALFTTEKSFEEFCGKVSVYDKSPYCGCVWTKDFVAYRCKTCATSPCMSVCAACFEKGNHEGHEYNIFRSEAGGACDCGDASVMKESGFCSRHGVNRVVPDDLPASLLTLPKLIMERILIMLLHSLRYLVKNSILESSFPSKIPDPLCESLDIFIEAIKCGSPVRSWVADLLLSEDYYHKLTANQHFGGVVTPDMKAYHEECLNWLPEAVKRLPMCYIPDEIQDKERFSRSKFVYKNLLQELMFWVCRFEFPEHLILFILNMLPDARIKREFARYFVQHYIFVAPSLSGALHVDDYSNRIVHISVQLFSNSELAYLLAKEEALLEMFMISINFMVTKKLIDSKTGESDFHQTVSVQGDGLRNNAYWAIVSDLVNCLSHNEVARLFLNNDDSLKIWMRILTCFSGMNLTTRQTDRHIEYDPQNILLAFYSEREACASPLWVVLDVLRDASNLDLSMKVIEMCKETIIELLDALGADDPKGTGIPFHRVSFHYPIHRYFALFVANAIGRQGLRISDLDINQNLARRLLGHPMQVLCTAHEIQCNMWVRNGLNMSTQQLAYRQSFFCTFFIDADLFMLQLLSCYMSPDIFVSSVFDRCRVTNCLTVEPETPPIQQSSHGAEGQPEPDRLHRMFESAFTLLLSVLSIQTQLGISDKTIIENELVAVLSTQNWTHSGLMEHIPQCHDMHAGEKSKRFTEPLTKAIDELSVTVEGDAMTQTEYSLRDEAWRRYDPIFTTHRALYKKNVQQAHTNYFKYLQRCHKLPSSILESSVWTPYCSIRIVDERYSQLNNLLNCRTLHTAIFMVIYKYLHKHTAVTEQTLCMAITILEGALFASPRENDDGLEVETEKPSSSPNQKTSDRDAEWQKMLTMWFKTNNMTTNIRQVIDQVQITWQETFHDAMETDEQLNNQPEVDPEEPERCIVIQESIITMLIKLHTRFSGVKNSFVFPAEFVPDLDPPNPIPPTPVKVIEKILLFAASKSPHNQKVIVDICGTAAVSSPSVSDDKTRYESERERRKQAALDMQQRLLKEFASKQKKFLEQVEMDLDLPADPEAEVEMETNVVDDNRYDCVICGASEDSTINIVGSTDAERTNSAKSQIMGMVALVQSSSLLGFRTESDELRPLRPVDSNIKPTETCRKFNREHHENLKMKFPQEIGSFTLGTNIDWEWAPQVSTCGHHLHVSCYHDYMKWVKRDETGYLRFEEGLGFQCPFCRQTSNLVVPCNVQQERPVPPESLRKLLKPHVPDRTLSMEDQDFQKSLWEIDNLIVSNVPIRTIRMPESQVNQESSSEVEGSPIDPVRMIDVNVLSVDEILKACQDSTEAILAENRIVLDKDATMQLTSRGVFQGQLEYELCTFGGTLLLEKKPPQLSVVQRKIPIGPLFHVLAKTIRVTGDKPNNEYTKKIWNQLTGSLLKVKETSDCPLLMKDPIALLIELCVSIYPFTIDEYQTVVRVLYNLSLVQALVQISCKFSPEERRAWKSNVSASLGGIPFDADKLDCLLGQVIACLPKSLFNDDVAEKLMPPSTQCYTSTVWTSQSVQSSLEEVLLQFMRISSLLQFHIFENMSTKSQFRCAPAGENELVYLAKYLGMLDSASSTPMDSSCTFFAKWPNSPKYVINSWCKEVETVVSSDRHTSLQLMNRHKIWKQPAIVDLPEDYTNLFTKFRDITCPRCKFKPREPCVCLMCGQFVCYKGMCQHPRDLYNDKDKTRIRITPQGAAVHARHCGNGTVILLHIHNTTVIVVRGSRSCVWGTLYLDHHGEEDRGWKRGRRLVIKPQRLKLINYQWLNHIFDNACRGWTRHRNQM
ncbi:E3 ubiquitin-protein ligase ubr3-like [Styela clava]